MKPLSFTLTIIIFVAALALGANGGYASTLSLKIIDNANPVNSVTIIDGEAADSSSLTGSILWSGSIGGWDASVKTGKGYPLFGTGSSLDLQFEAKTANGTTTNLTVMLTQTDNSSSVTGWNLHAEGTISGGIDPVIYSAYYSNTNDPFALTNQIGTTLAFSGGGAFLGNIAGPATPVSPYSITQVLKFQGTGVSGLSTGDATLVTNPEPAAILLLGTGLVGVALLVRRKRT